MFRCLFGHRWTYYDDAERQCGRCLVMQRCSSWSITFAVWKRVTRLTGPEDNRAVLGWFHRGEERRTKGKGFAEGFAAAAAKGPVKSPERAGCPGCNDADC